MTLIELIVWMIISFLLFLAVHHMSLATAGLIKVYKAWRGKGNR